MFSLSRMSKWIAILIFASFMSCQADLRLPKISVDPETGHFMDPAGRVRIFHGLNSVEKHEPWYEINFREGDLMEAMRDMGLNIIRLGNMWTGWQPESSDSINDTYVEILEEMVENLSTLGIYTLLDTHQDVLWQTHGAGYWGVPPWIKDKMNIQTHEYPWPLTEVNRWECGYFTEEIAFGFDQMYNNVNGVADDFARFWQMVAERFGKFDSVIGYELMNEPFAGNVFEEGHLKILPGIAGEKNLVPFYDIIQSGIRKIDDETIIFWEPTTWSYLFPIPAEYNEVLLDIFKPILEKYFYTFVEIYCGELQPNVTDTKIYKFDEMKAEIQEMIEQLIDIKDVIPRSDFIKETYSNSKLKSMEMEPSIWGPGFIEPPGGLEYRNRSALSWHYYCWINDWNGGSNNDPYKPFAKWFCDEFFGPMVANTADYRGMEVGGAKMLTEFGLCIPDVNFPDSQNTVECLAVMDEADKSFNSWTYWNRDVWDNEGNIKPDTAIAFARPYPMATSGIPKEMNFDLWTKSFRYEYYPDLSISKEHAGEFPTEIAVPEMQYPGGRFKVNLSDLVSWNIAPYNPNIIQIIHDPQTIPNGQSIFVEIQSSI